MRLPISGFDHFRQQILALYERIRRDMAQERVKAVSLLAIVILLFTFTRQAVVVLFVVSVLASLLFGWEHRVYILLAFLFVATIPVFLLVGSDVQAEQVAIYAYHLVVADVVLGFSHHLQRTYERGSSSAPSEGRAPTFLLLAILFVSIGGLYYLNDRMNREFARQWSVIERVSGRADAVDIVELDRMKKQLQEAIDLLRAAEERGAR